MSGPNIRELLKWKEDLKMQASKVASELEPLLLRRGKLREQLEAIERLISSRSDEGSPTSTNRSESPNPLPVASGQGANGRQFTPVSAYWRPILESLVELGGSARSDKAIECVGSKMAKTLTEADREPLPSGVAIRWHNRVAWQRENMKRRGLLRSDSPRGIWEITEKGRLWLAKGSSV
jgi:Mrr N-terminal domain